MLLLLFVFNWLFCQSWSTLVGPPK